jgi:gamma-glutamylcyclotransferase (GGCT)/AIG2-like uncharacterized protein YtfP
MPEYLFVYGTLRQALIENVSAELAALMQSLSFIGTGMTYGQLFDLGEFPGAIVGANFATRIVGEVYEMPHPQAVFAVLDEYEGFIPGELEASMFARIIENILLPDGRTLPCWLYVYNDWVLNGRLIEAGDYVAYLQRQ